MVSAWPDEARVLRAGDRVCLIVRCRSCWGRHPGPVSQPVGADASKAGRLSGAARYWFIADPRRRLRRLSAPSGGGRVAWLQRLLQPFRRDRRSARLLGLCRIDRRQLGSARHRQRLRPWIGRPGIRRLRSIALPGGAGGGRSRAIAVLGQSMGGSSVLSAVDRDMFAQYFTERFRAAIAYYPVCTLPGVLMTAPMMILMGEADDWTPADRCRVMIAKARPDGAPIALTVYPGAHHAFDVAWLEPGA